jgi:phage repressor protein C with HTH and peptisase S24 domain
MDLRNDSAIGISLGNRTIPILQAANSYSRSGSNSPYFSGMDPVRTLIVDRSKELNKSLKSLSLAIGKSHSYLQQFVKRGIPLHLPEDVRPTLAPLLGVDETELRSADFPPIKKQTVTTSNARIAGSARIDSTIPAYGHAMGGKDGRFIWNGNKIADVLAPPSLANVPNAYAVYVVGDSMEQRYFAGELVFVNPNLPVRQRDFVVVQILSAVEGDPPDAYVKQFVSQSASNIRLMQFKPKKTIEFPVNRVISVHRIIMGGDG